MTFVTFFGPSKKVDHLKQPPSHQPIKMPKNMRGGKGSKKGKNSGDTRDQAGPFPDRAADQIYGRVTKLLGNRRMICFCNDGIDRVCKVRSSLCYGKSGKGQWICIGDIVLLSFRYEGGEDSGSEEEIEGGDSKVAVLASGRKEVGDILFKFHRDHWKFIRRDGVIHRNLLLALGEGDGGEDIFEDAGAELWEKGNKVDSMEMTEADIAAI